MTVKWGPSYFMPERGTPGGAGARESTGWRRPGAVAALLACLALPPVAPAAAAPPDQIATDLEAALTALARAEAEAAPDTDTEAAPGSATGPVPEPVTGSVPGSVTGAGTWAGVGAALLIARADLAGVAARATTDPDLGPPLGPVLDPVLGGPPALRDGTPALPAAAPEVGRLNLRLVLTMLSQAYGDEGNGRLLQAQSDPAREALVLRAGTVRLADLAAALQAEGLAAVAPEAAGGSGAVGGVELTLPLVIWPGAALVLGPGEVLHLNRAEGAFVMNFGRLQIEGATVAATPGVNPQVRAFRPFVTTADGGTLVLRGARMTGLGFGETLKFSGVSVLRSLLRPADRPSRIEGTLFQDVLSVGIAGDGGAQVTGNWFRDARGAALVVTQARGVQVTGNLFAGRLPTNAIRLEGGAQDGVVAGNVILGGQRAGIVVREDSPGAQIGGNVVWAREGGGILINGSACAVVAGNLVIGNAQKGIELRNAPGGRVLANSVLSNASIGIWVADQPPGSTTRIEGNVVAFNNAGLAGARGERLLLQGNDLSRQYLQFLSGDLAPQAAHLARDMRGTVPLLLSAAGSGPATPADLAPDPACLPAPVPAP